MIELSVNAGEIDVQMKPASIEVTTRVTTDPQNDALTIAGNFKTRILQDGGNFEYDDDLINRIEGLQSLGFYDRMSVVITPNGFKQGRVYGLKGTDLIWTRTTGAHRNKGNYLEFVPYNRALQSNDFSASSQWIRTGCVTTANVAIAPDGTMTADSLDENNTTTVHYISQTVGKTVSASINYNFSFYAKAGERDYVRIKIGTSSFANAAEMTVNLLTGQAYPVQIIGTGFSINSFEVTQAENGFWKIKIYATTDGSANVTFGIQAYVDSDVASYTTAVVGTKALYLWKSQITLDVNDHPYQDETTIANFPAIDYFMGYNAIRREYQRSNICNRSEDFSQAVWTKVGVAASLLQRGLNGAPTVGQVFETAVNSPHYFQQQVTKAANTLPYSCSIYVKGGFGRDWVELRISDNLGGTNGARRWFNITTGQMGVGNTFGSAWSLFGSSIENLNDGWKRITVSVTPGTQTTLVMSAFFCLADGVTGTYIGEVDKGFYFFGAQIEQAAGKSSYVRTDGGSATRTSDDNIFVTGISSLIGQTEGTIFAELIFENDGISKRISISDATVNNRIFLTVDNLSQINATVITGNVTHASLFSGAQPVNTPTKVALSYKNNYVALFVKGVKVAEDLVLPVPPCSRLGLDDGTGGVIWSGYIRCLALSKEWFTDQECIDLTA